jgi:hypothetical protein
MKRKVSHLTRDAALALAALFVLARPAMAWTPADYAADPLGQYLNEIKASRTVAFVSDCQLDAHSKGVMIVQPDHIFGQFYVISDKAADGSAVVSIEGRIDLGQPTPAVYWSEGVTTPELRKTIALSLLNQPYQLLLAAHIDEIYQKPARQAC